MSFTNHFYLYIALIFLAALCGVLFYRKRNRIILPVVIVLVCIFIFSVISFLAGRHLKESRPVDHFNTPVMLACWGYFFSQVLEDPRFKKYVGWATITLIAYSIINSFITGLFVTPSHVLQAATIFYLILGALLLVQMLDMPSKENIFTHTLFLIALAVVWFNMISSLNFFLFDLRRHHKPTGQFIGKIHWYSNYIYYSILMIAMIFQKKLNRNV